MADPVELRVFGTCALTGPPNAVRLGTQPKALALLAYLALAQPRGLHSRERIVAMFWPDLPTERARAGLRNALYEIRQGLGEAILTRRGDDAVGIAPDALWCDAWAFAAAIAQDHLAEALSLYQGDVMAGTFGDSPTLDHWIEDERRRYREAAADAAWSLAQRYEADTDLTSAARWARKAARLAGPDERRIRRVMTLLAGAGDRAGAMRVYTDFAKYLSQELEAQPDPETTQLAERIRAAGA